MTANATWPKCVDGHPYDPDRFRCFDPSHFCQRETCHHDEMLHFKRGCSVCDLMTAPLCAEFVAYENTQKGERE